MIRNLHFCVLPRAHGQKWRKSVEHLKRRWHLFNGRKIVSIFRGTDCDPPDDVRGAFADDSIEYLEFDNDPSLREVVSFVPMLERLESMRGDEITFCCHGKGATHGHDDSICHVWGDLMFSVCLDYQQLVECALQDKPICGAFRTRAGDVGVPWHFSGTFYWIRHDCTFSRNWRNIRRDWMGSESWPGVQFAFEESACLFLDNCNSLYDEDYWARNVFPSFHHWQESLRSCGLSTIPYSPPKWFLQRHPNFRPPNGTDGFGTTLREKRSWRRTAGSLLRSLRLSTG